MARPRISVDIAIVLRMRDVEKLGWSRMAEEYRKLTGKYISRDTLKRRCKQAKAQRVVGWVPISGKKPQLTPNRITVEINGGKFFWVKKEPIHTISSIFADPPDTK